MDLEKEAFEFKEKKKKRTMRFVQESGFGPRINKIEHFNGMHNDDIVECLDPILDHPIQKFDKVKINFIEEDFDKTVYIYFMRFGEPYRMKASRFKRVEQ